MSELAVTYDNTKITGRKPFNADDIIQTLVSEPMNVDIGCISYTPVAVVLDMPRAEYTRRHLGTNISRKYDVGIICRDDRLVIKKPDTDTL